MNLKSTLNSLATVDTFDDCREVANAIYRLQQVLVSKINDVVADLEDEKPFTAKQRKALIAAIREEFVLTGADLD